MNSINFPNEEKFNSCVHYYSEGFESKLYRYIDNDCEFLIKKYYDSSRLNIDKIEKINKLQTEGLLKPTSLVSIDNKIEGFMMDFKRGLYPLSVEKKDLDELQKYHLIVSLKEILSSLKEEGCLYGDLNIKNILTDGEQVYLCDSLNVQVGGHPFDEISSTMHKYIEKTGTTEGLDLYMLNLLTVYLFNDIEYDSIIESIEFTVMNMFNKQSFDNMIGVTDTMETLNICSDIFLTNKVCDKLLIDYMDINMIDSKDKCSRL